MIKTISRDHRGSEVLVNENNILYVIPSMNGGTIVYFDKVNFLVLNENYDEFKKRFESVRVSFNHINDIDKGDLPAETLKTQYRDSDQYPDHLPRLPTGFVDKRTTQYKEFIASQENNK